MMAFLEAKEWPLVSEVPFSEGKQKGGILCGRSYAAVLCSVDRDDEKAVGLKPVFVTPLDLLPSVLANGGEEVQTTVNWYEFDLRVSGHQQFYPASQRRSRKRRRAFSSFIG